METPKQIAQRLVYGTDKRTALYEALRCPACNDEDLEDIVSELEREFEKARLSPPQPVTTSTTGTVHYFSAGCVPKVIYVDEVAAILEAVAKLMLEGKLGKP